MAVVFFTLPVHFRLLHLGMFIMWVYMISKPSLKALIIRWLGDAKVLLKNRRYPAAIYLAGYGIELALKYRICKIMEFTRGFPENKSEFNKYYQNARKTILRETMRSLWDIRHHNLPILLRYSGKQVNIEAHFNAEWEVIKNWNPEMRYTSNTIRKHTASDFFKSASAVIAGIL